MALNSLADIAAALRQTAVVENKGSGAGLTVSTWNEYFTATGGLPVAGAMPAIGSGVGVPDNTGAGAISLQDFTGSTGRITRVEYTASQTCRLMLADALAIYGQFDFSEAGTYSVPNFSARVPNADYSGLQLWFIATVNTTGFNLTGTYTNQAGTTSRTLPAFNPGTFNVPRAVQLPLASGDCGIKALNTLSLSGGSSGQFVIVIARPLWQGRVDVANTLKVHGMEEVGAPLVYPSSYLFLMVNSDSANKPVVEMNIEIAAG